MTPQQTPLKADKHAPFPESRLRVVVWEDSLIERLGHDPRSIYVERYWLAILGPSATLLLRRLARDLEDVPDGFEIQTADLAQELGLGSRGGKHSPFWRSVDRICRFGGARRHLDLLEVRRKLPPLTARQAQRLPGALRSAHQAWLDDQLLARTTRPQMPPIQPHERLAS